MNLYTQMLADLRRREAELLSELKNVKALQAAVKPLTASGRGVALRAVPQEPLTIQQTSGAQPDASAIYTQLKVMAERRTLAELAAQALRDAGKPLPLKQLIQAVRERGGGKDQTVKQLRSSLVPSLRRRLDLFTAERRGFYGLKEWKDGKAD